MSKTAMEKQLQFKSMEKRFFKEKVKESIAVIKKIAALSAPPLILQFSGGKDSMCLLGLVREAGVPEDRFYAAYMASGLELKSTIPFVKETCERLKVRLLISNPSMHKGNIFKRIEQFQSFPNLGSFAGGGKRLWCCRDLKLRPQKKLLEKTFGKKQSFYRLEGIRRFESDRRKVIYREYATTFMRPDDELKGSFEVYPVLNFSDSDVEMYLETRKLPVIGLYKEFGVSGCSFCPFYGPDLYGKIMAAYPNHYDRFIEWEEKLNLPSVHGGVFLRDIKAAVLNGTPLPETRKTKFMTPCSMEFEGKVVHTCAVYGHLWIDGKCLRCEIEQEVK